MDVGDVDFIDDSVDTFPEKFPHEALVVDASAVLLLHHFFLHGSQFMGWHVNTSSSLGFVFFKIFVVLNSQEIGLFLEATDNGFDLLLLS